MLIPTGVHVAVVDGEQFLLMCNHGTATTPDLRTEATPEVSTSNKSAGVRHQDTRGKKVGKEPLDRLAHAAGVAEWLNKAVLDGRIKRLVVIAAPDTLGEMRPHYSKHLQDALVGEIDRQLTGMPGAEIAKALEAV
jgi:protein required for attachment to host cells